LQPWTRFTVAADGALFPCCVTDMPPVGHIGREGEGIDGPAIQAFRRALLVGEVPPVCVGCTNAPHTSTAELEATVRMLQQRVQ
ncbi:MAG: SPASM domain-containing protein, partial [Rubrivivax sp.]